MAKMQYVILLLTLVWNVEAEEKKHESTLMVDTITSNGYVAQQHKVTTTDGYILSVYRIPFARNQDSGDESRPVVYLMHAIFKTSYSFLSLGPEYGLGFNLADAGYDVWLGNARGNIYSRNHVTLNPDNRRNTTKFFDFTYEEIGTIDLPNTIDYILNQTGNKRLHFIGHSLGGTAFLVMGSMRPEYNEKIATAHLLASPGYIEHFSNKDLNFYQSVDKIYAWLVMSGFIEVNPPKIINKVPDEMRPLIESRCFNDTSFEVICETFGFDHYLRGGFNLTETELESKYGGGSLKILAHYAQSIRDKAFSRYNYGARKNKRRYNNSTVPPSYNISLITARVFMYYSLKDDWLDERDLLKTAADMPNVVVRKIASDSFEHKDYTESTYAKELVYDDIIKDISIEHKRYNNITAAAMNTHEEQNDSPYISPETSSEKINYMTRIKSNLESTTDSIPKETQFKSKNEKASIDSPRIKTEVESSIKLHELNEEQVEEPSTEWLEFNDKQNESLTKQHESHNKQDESSTKRHESHDKQDESSTKRHESHDKQNESLTKRHESHDKQDESSTKRHESHDKQDESSTKRHESHDKQDESSTKWHESHKEDESSTKRHKLEGVQVESSTNYDQIYDKQVERTLSTIKAITVAEEENVEPNSAPRLFISINLLCFVFVSSYFNLYF